MPRSWNAACVPQSHSSPRSSSLGYAAAKKNCSPQPSRTSVTSAAFVQEPIDNTPEACPQRRSFLLSAALAATCFTTLAPVLPSAAYVDLPESLRRHVDKLDGYTFVYPSTWTQVRSCRVAVRCVSHSLVLSLACTSYNTGRQLQTPAITPHQG